jgi:hypothetical protein
MNFHYNKPCELTPVFFLLKNIILATPENQSLSDDQACTLISNECGAIQYCAVYAKCEADSLLLLYVQQLRSNTEDCLLFIYVNSDIYTITTVTAVQCK